MDPRGEDDEVLDRPADNRADRANVAVRVRVRAAVAARVPVDQRERESLERFLTAFDLLDDPFSESADPVHVTGSALVVGPRGVLLHRHKRLGIWLQPGGHVDPGETPWAAALREAGEETGLDVRFAGPTLAPDDMPELVHVDVHPGPCDHTHLDLRYLVDGGHADPAPPAGESQEIGWFDWPTAIGMADVGLCGALESLRPH
jgi:8-oxo-dGTP pyrophosphatase MutT (NUDIX family)